MTTDVSRIAAAPIPSGSNGAATHERSHHKPRKFSTFMKRLANLKAGPSSSSSSRNTRSITGRSHSFSSGTPSAKQRPNISHPPSLSHVSNSHLSFDVTPNYHFSGSNDSITSTSDLDVDYDDGQRTAHASTRSRPASSAITYTTSGFSSPTPSMRSLTTLTTVQSTAPGSMLNANYNPHPSHHHNPNGPPQMYSVPFDPHAEHSPAVPGLLHPSSYNAATAHGIWTDNASIITLASSSKRHRRHSFDTDASVRALAPSSVFGGSRESLPLSVLSSNFESTIGGRSVAGERTSLHGSTIGGRSPDTISVLNGGTGSIRGEISGGSPLVLAAGPCSSNRESLQMGRHSRRSSAWNVDDDVDRRSLSVRSASIKEGIEGEQAEVMSVRDGSSNVGVWHGVLGKPGLGHRQTKE